VLTGGGERLAAGRQHAHIRRCAHERGHQLGSWSEQVLAVIDHEQELLVAHEREQQR
jgi:hypothetical protein